MARKKEEVIFSNLTASNEKCFFCEETAVARAECGRPEVAVSICCCGAKKCRQRAIELLRRQVKKNEITRTVEAGRRKFLARNKLDYVIEASDIRSKDMEAVNRLLRQLSPKNSSIGMIELGEVVSHGGLIITVRDISNGNALIGMGTLVPIRKLFSFCGTIEDVVVDKKYRGIGLGRKITTKLIEAGARLGMKFIDLTSRPQRERANKLYRSLGFKKRATNLYRLSFMNK